MISILSPFTLSASISVYRLVRPHISMHACLFEGSSTIHSFTFTREFRCRLIRFVFQFLFSFYSVDTHTKKCREFILCFPITDNLNVSKTTLDSLNWSMQMVKREQNKTKNKSFAKCYKFTISRPKCFGVRLSFA